MLRYETYAKLKNQPITPELIAEYENLYIQNKKSNSALFYNMGLPEDYWSNVIHSIDPLKHYNLMEENIPEILEKISKLINLSIFSNIKQDKNLPALGMDANWFKYILHSREVGKPKPALDGFYKMIELSALPPEEILYIGDSVEKDIIPAKKAGIKTGLVFESSPEADYSFKGFKEIYEFVKENNEST